MAKPGLDGHDRGIKILARAYRDAGMGHLFGIKTNSEMIINAAIQEDADVIALSVLSGAHMTIFKKVKSLMNDEGLDDVLLTGGGIIPEGNVTSLSNEGVGKLLDGTSVNETIDYITTWVNEHRK